MGRVPRAARQATGRPTNIVTGILGAVLAGFIYQWVTGLPWNYGWTWASFGVACLGALGLLLVINLVTRGSRTRQ